MIAAIFGLKKNRYFIVFLNNYYCFAILTIAFTQTSTSATRRVTTNDSNLISEPSKTITNPKDLHVPLEWKNLLDPTTDEFWMEGNHRPDQGFLLWAKNPSIENAKLYLIRMNAKRDRLHLMQKQQELANKELIKHGVIANDYNFLAEMQPIAAKSQEKWAATHLFFIFSPDCPHCKKQAEVLAGLENVTPMQIGGDKLVYFDRLPATVWARKEDIEQYVKEKVVPVLLIFSSSTSKMVSVKGVHSLPEIEKISKSLANKGQK